jgi:hypothetical protein
MIMRRNAICWVVAVPQGEAVAFAVDDNRLPPAIVERLLRNDEMASRDLVPGRGQAPSNRQAVLVTGRVHRSLRFERQGHNEITVEVLPDVWHKPTAVGVKATDGQFLGDLGYVFRTGFIDLEPHRVGGLGHEVRLGIDEPGARGFCWSSKPRTISGGVTAAAAAADDRVTAPFAAAAFTVDLVRLLFRFVILGSPEKPKDPGEGALWRVWWNR